MDIALVTATAMEMRAVLAGIPPEDLPPALSPLRALSTPQADLPPLRVGKVILRPLLCGIGPINAAFALGRFLGTGPPVSGVLNLGLAGSYDPVAGPPGSLVTASEEIWPEYGLLRANGIEAEGLGFALAQQDGRPIFDRIALEPILSLERMGLNTRAVAVRGAAVTVAGVSGTPDAARRLRERTRGLMENMEGFALALGCLTCSPEPLPFVEIRSISNMAGFRPPESWDLPPALAGLGAALRLLLFRARNAEGAV